jgi:hypothetical protein
VRTICFAPESRYLCLFEAASAKIVQEVSEAMQLPFTRIIQVTEYSL